MRPFILLLLLLALSANAFGDCARYAFWVHPSSDTVHQSTRFLVEAYGKTVSLLDSLNEGCEIQLQGEDHRVSLEVVERHDGYSKRQVLLMPDDPLRVGERYRLRVKGISDERERKLMMAYDSEKEKEEWMAWYVRKGKDRRSPEWQKRPEHTGNSYEELGCGPSVKAFFEMEGRDASEIWVKVELKEAGKGNVDRYILYMDEPKLRVGHGMCSGAFSFSEDSDYKARFRLMDSSANVRENWSEWIAFESPRGGDGWW